MAYHPNGAIAGYTLASGIAHSSTQNTRGLPLLWRDAGVVQDLYAFDANGNVTAITDQQEGLSSRAMTLYDGLDRLRTVSGIWGAGSFGYDPLDNLRTSTIGARALNHNIDAATNRLTSLSGSQSIAFGYDANGNVSARGSQGYVSGQSTASLRRAPAADQRSTDAKRQGSSASKSSAVLALGNSTSNALR